MSASILFLTPQLPFPPHSGGVIKSYHLLDHLIKTHQLVLGCLLKNGESTDALQQHLPHLSIISHPVNIPRSGLNWLKSLSVGVPLTIYRNMSDEFAAKVLVAAKSCEVIFVDHYLMHQYVPKDFKGRVVVHQHNAEFLMWQRMAEQTRNVIKRWVIGFEAERICQYEKAMCSAADSVLAAPNDAQALIDVGATDVNFIDTYHLGDESALHLPPLAFAGTEQRLLYVGTLTWQANLDGLLWFLRYVWPVLIKKHPDLKFSIVGRCDEAIAEQLKSLVPSIDLRGFVDDLEKLYQSHRVYIAPLRFGSGIKVKVVNGLYRGMPTVTTDVGAEGLAVIDGEHILIANEPDCFANHIHRLLTDEALWHCISAQSRQLMASRYTWQQVYDKVDEAIGCDE